jgi:hypothetical protein
MIFGVGGSGRRDGKIRIELSRFANNKAEEREVMERYVMMNCLEKQER